MSIVAGTCFVLLLLVGSVDGQYAWTENLYEVLTVAGLREDTPVGTYLGTLGIRVPTDIITVVFSSNSTYIAVNETTGEVKLGAALNYRAMPSFEVEFFARDLSKGFQNNTIVTVNVRPVNHPPVFDLPVYRVSIRETVKPQTIIYSTLYVTDQDTGDNGTLTLTCDGDATACQTFGVTQQMVRQGSYLGSVSTLLPLDFQTHRSYNMTIKAEDNGNPPLTAISMLIINIESSADNRPVFINTPIILVVNESSPNTANLGVVQARSGNTDNPNALSFSISGDTNGWFLLDRAVLDNVTKIYSAQIRTNGQISRAQMLSSQYQFNIIAAELFNGQPTSVVSETTVQVLVQDINNFAPAFQYPTYTADVTEGLGIGALVPGLNMIVTDLDSLDNAYFAIMVTSINPSPVPDIFLVQPTFGQGTAAVSLIANKPEYLRYADPLKRRYTVQVAAVETRTKELYSGSTTITVNVESAAPSPPPTFTQLVYLTSLVDNRGTGSIVTDQIKAIGSGSDSGQITYSIVNNGTFSSYFSIDPNTGLVSLARLISYNQTGQYVVLPIKASTPDGSSALTTLRVEIIDNTHRGPSFGPNPSVTATVLEGGTDLIPPIQFVASPLERDRVVSYTIIAGNKNNTFTLTTKPQPSGQPIGIITMNNGVDFNDTPDKSGIFQLVVQASDNGPTPLYTNLSVFINVKDTNNHDPVFSPTTYSKTISEITPGGTSLLTINATDADAPNNDNSKIHYIISDGSRDNFIIDYTTGLISVASQANLSIDRFGNQYNITVLAIDGGSPPRTGTATVFITVTDSVYRQPTFNQPFYVYYVFETVSTGTTIGNVTARSPDRRATLVYSIVPDSFTAINSNGQPVPAQNGSLDYRNSFSVDPKNGGIIVTGPLNRNSTAKIDFTVQANVTNAEKPIPPATVNVTVYILRQQPSSDIVIFLTPTEGSTLIISIYNNLPVGTDITQLNSYQVATKKPVTNYTYYPSGSDGQNFTMINPKSGVITLVRSLIQEKMPLNLTYQVIASADPPSKASSTANVLIMVRAIDADIPQFTERLMYNFTIPNNVNQSYRVGTIQATLPGSVITYAIKGYNVEAFYLDNKTGIIYVNDPRLVNQANFFAFLATASAGNPPKTSQPILVYIYVLHLYNIDPPYFIGTPYEYYTLDTVPINSAIGQINAADRDPFHNSTITYRIVSGNETGFYSVDPNTGSITTVKNLVARPNDPYVLNISATVSGVPPMTAYTTVRIFVANVSGQGVQLGFFRPETDGQVYYVYENQDGVFVVTAVGYSSRSKNLTYSLKDPDTMKKYRIDPVTGNLTSNGRLTYDPTKPPDVVCITVGDDVTPVMTASRCITVYTLSSQPPSFDCPGNNSTLTGSVPEKSPTGTLVTKVKGCRPDGQPVNLSYFITGGNVDSLNCTGGGQPPFTINKTIGEVKTNAVLYWNCTSTYTLNITVTDGSDPSQAGPGATRQLVITIEPTDSSGPSFGKNLNGSCRGVGEDVSEGILDFTPAGTAVIQMYAGDCDAPQFRNNTYLLDPSSIKFNVPGQSSNTGVPGAFTINPVTGFVYTNLTDYRKYSQGYFQMTITAVDSKNRRASATLTVYIVREGQRIRYIFDKTPLELRPVAFGFAEGLDSYLSLVSPNTEVNGIELRTHVDMDAVYYFNQTDMCFEVIKDMQVLSVKDAVAVFQMPDDNAQMMLTNLKTAYNVSRGPERCYVKTTTHWWSGYWFLWWLLIALGLFLFVLGVILNILACCFWPIYTRGYLKSRPYIVLDEPPPTSPVSDFEWQETVHRIN